MDLLLRGEIVKEVESMVGDNHIDEINEMLNELPSLKISTQHSDYRLRNMFIRNVSEAIALDILNEEDAVDIKFAKIKKDAIIPSKEEGNAGYDVYGLFDDDLFIIPPHDTIMIPTGIASAIPYDYYFQIEERGSTGSKGIKKSAGVVDANYRGEWFIPITNANNVSLVFYNDKVFENISEAGEAYFETHPTTSPTDDIFYPMSKAIAQAILLPVPKTKVTEISYDELKNIESNRGTGALGSSGK